MLRRLTTFLHRPFLLPTVKPGPHRQRQQSDQSPAKTPLPDARRRLLIGALSLRFRQRLRLFQLTFLRQPFGFVTPALLLQLSGMRGLAIPIFFALFSLSL